MSQLAHLAPEHVVGLVVGEGCFYVESCADPKYRLGWRIRPGFCIEMRHDEEDVLEAVQEMLGCGAIYHLDFGRYRGYEDKGWLPHAKFRVANTSDLHARVVPFFRAHPLFGRKRQAFELFAEIVDGLSTKRHATQDGLMELKRLAEKLSSHNRRGKQASANQNS